MHEHILYNMDGVPPFYWKGQAYKRARAVQGDRPLKA